MDRGRMKGNLPVILLAVIAESEEPLYGLEIAREIQARTDGELELASGSLYPPLHRLQRDDLVTVETRVSPHGSGHVSYYSITDKGLKVLAKEREETKTFMQVLKSFVQIRVGMLKS